MRDGVNELNRVIESKERFAMDKHNCVCNLFLYLIYGVVLASDNLKDTFEETLEPLFKTAASEFTQHEIVHPVIFKDNKQLVSTFYKNGHHDDIVIKFVSRNHNFVIPLKRNKNLFSKSYIEKSYKHNGTYYVHRPHHHKLRRHCFYHGYIWGAPHSQVALSTCDGISGYIDNGHETFHIEPAGDLGRNSHRLYNDAHSMHKPSQCGAHKLGHSTKQNETIQVQHTRDVLHRMRRAVQEPYDATTGTRYVEMYIVNDYRTFDSNYRKVDRQNRKTQNIANIVSKLYQPFNIYIALVGIENWTTDDQIVISQVADSTLENFLYYRKTRINPKHPNDNAQLITDTKFNNGVVGKAIKGTICTYQYSGGVNLNLATEGQTAATIAHELGHNFGMDHDNYTICKCKEDKCIMAATSGGINTPRHWSSCSMLTLQEAFEMGMDYCLRNKPEELFQGPVCGNGFTEDGEQCDCGLPEECNNKCCNATTCTLTPGASCATGGCCDLNSCKPKDAATQCRASMGECDLPEYCWGNSPYCPADVYLQNGVECLGGQSYCYNGHCTTHTGQCKLLWGTTGRVSDPVCFKHLNTNGSKHGNCGYNWTTNTYQACLRDDVMCGLLHCVHQNEKLMFWRDNLAHATPATFLTIGTNTYVCRGAMLDVGLDMPDPGMVPDGAKCEDRKICVDHKCTPLSHLKFPSCAEGCSGRGRCNSKGHCHCDEGFGQPVCDVGGDGGSIDSGPAAINDDKSLLIGLLVVFLVILPLLGLLAFAAYHFRADIFAWWNAKIANKNKSQRRPIRPSHAPPKRDQAIPLKDQKPQQPLPPYTPNPPTYKDAVRNTAATNDRPVTRPVRPAPPPASSSVISAPVLTGSTHKDTRHHIQTSPQPDHRQVKKVPKKLPERPVDKNTASPPTVELPIQKKPDAEGSKSRFGPMFKMPSFGRSTESPGAESPKPATKKQEEVPAENIVKKRELHRVISNPVLISTTDRRSKHYCAVDKLKVHKQPAADDSKTLSPPVPPHISLMRSESDTARRNRPLPPRPLSMPDSECGDLETEVKVKDGRKSMAGPSPSPRIPHRPPPPPQAAKQGTDLRQALESELARLDDIQIEVPSHSSHTSESKTNPKPKPFAAKANIDSSKKPIVPDSSKKPSKTTVTKAKSDDGNKPNWEHVKKPIFNPRARPGLSDSANKQSGIKKGSSGGSNAAAAKKTFLGDTPSSAGERKISTDSLDDDPNSAISSVSQRSRMFEAQKKPLLSDKKDVARTQSHGEPKAPMTPPKPRPVAKKVRSVNV